MMPKTDLHPAAGWLVIAGVVLVFDLLNRRSLTSYARAHPVGTWLVGGVVSAHLLDHLPPRLDPFTHAARLVRR